MEYTVLCDILFRIAFAHAKPVALFSYLKKRNEFELNTGENKLAYQRASYTLLNLEVIEITEHPTIANEKLLSITPKGTDFVNQYGEHNTYTKYLAELQKEKYSVKKEFRRKNFKDLFSHALTIISVSSAIYFGWQNQLSKQEVESLREIRTIDIQVIDSLNSKLQESPGLR